MTVSDIFLDTGFVNLGEIIDKKQCKDLMKSLDEIRCFEKKFLKETIFVDENDPDVNIMERGTGPGPGRNLVEKVNLEFIEKNKVLQKVLSNILGSDYKIMTKKFVMGMPQNMIPDWILEKTKGVGSVNLCAYIKPEYRDMTYFHGIDFHQDIIDHKERKGDFLTLYVYLQDVTENMSPLFVVPNSHIFGATVFPHEIEIENQENLVYGNRNGKQEKLSFQILTGNAGTVYFWSAYSLHGTQPTLKTDVPRISLRYLIERGTSNEHLPIDTFLENIDGELQLKNTRLKSLDSGKNVKTGNQLAKEQKK